MDDRAYTIFAESMGRSAYARGTLAPREGMSADVPEMRKRPLLTMADMGMAHGHEGHASMAGMGHGSMKGSDHGAMKGMDHGSMSGMDHSAHGSVGAKKQTLSTRMEAAWHRRRPSGQQDVSVTKIVTKNRVNIKTRG